MKLHEAIKETRTAKQMIENPETDSLMKSLLIKAVKRSGEKITPAGPNATWEKALSDPLHDGNFRLWYNTEYGNTHVISKNE
jgi:hypothetical protein